MAHRSAVTLVDRLIRDIVGGPLERRYLQFALFGGKVAFFGGVFLTMPSDRFTCQCLTNHRVKEDMESLARLIGMLKVLCAVVPSEEVWDHCARVS